MPGEITAIQAIARVRWKGRPIIIHSTRSAPAWIIAFHRFAEVGIGNAVALLLATIWPEEEITGSTHQ